MDVQGLAADDDRAFTVGALERELADKSALEDGVGRCGRLGGLRAGLRERYLIPPRITSLVHEDWMVYDDEGKRVGYATSFMYSLVLQRHIALARVRPDLTKVGSRVFLEFTVDHHYQKVAAHVARLCSTRNGRRR